MLYNSWCNLNSFIENVEEKKQEIIARKIKEQSAALITGHSKNYSHFSFSVYKITFIPPIHWLRLHNSSGIENPNLRDLLFQALVIRTHAFAEHSPLRETKVVVAL